MKKVAHLFLVACVGACGSDAVGVDPPTPDEGTRAAPSEAEVPEPGLRLGEFEDYAGRCGVPAKGYGDVGDRSQTPALVQVHPIPGGIAVSAQLAAVLDDGNEVFLMLVGGYGDLAEVPEAGTYSLPNPLEAEETPGVVLMFGADVDPHRGPRVLYVPSGGTLVLESASFFPGDTPQRVVGRLEGVTAVRVSVSGDGRAIPADDGCVASIDRLSFNVPVVGIQGPPARDGGAEGPRRQRPPLDDELGPLPEIELEAPVLPRTPPTLQAPKTSPVEIPEQEAAGEQRDDEAEEELETEPAGTDPDTAVRDEDE